MSHVEDVSRGDTHCDGVEVSLGDALKDFGEVGDTTGLSSCDLDLEHCSLVIVVVMMGGGAAKRGWAGGGGGGRGEEFAQVGFDKLVLLQDDLEIGHEGPVSSFKDNGGNLELRVAWAECEVGEGQPT